MRAAIDEFPFRGSTVQKSGARNRRVTTARTTQFTSFDPIDQLVRSRASVQVRAGPARSGSAQASPRRTYWKNRCSRR